MININPNNVLAYYNRAALFLQLEQYQNAMDDYSEAINLYPDFAKAYMNRSYVKNQLGQFKSAQIDYNIAQAKVQAYKSTVRDSTKYSLFADTTKKYDNLLALDADFAKKDFNNELLQHRDIDVNLKPLYKFVVVPENKIAMALERTYENKQVDDFSTTIGLNMELSSTSNNLPASDMTKLMQESEEALVKSRNSRTLFSMGVIEAENRQFNAALTLYNEAVEKDPNEAFYYINRGALQSEMIDFISSIDNNVQVLTLDNAGATKARVQDKRIRSYDYTSAIQDMKRAAELLPELPYVYYNLGNLYCLSSELPISIVNYTKAIELYPALAEAYYNRGLVLIYLKDKEKGCMDISKAGELGIPDAYNVIKKYCKTEE